MNSNLWLAQQKLDQAILGTPTGEARNLITEANMLILMELDPHKKKKPIKEKAFQYHGRCAEFLNNNDVEIVAICGGEGCVLFYRENE